MSNYEFKHKGDSVHGLFKSVYNENPSEFKKEFAKEVHQRVVQKIQDRKGVLQKDLNDKLVAGEE